MKKFTMLVSIFLFAMTAVSGDNPLWMVSSKEALLSYAIGQVNQGSVSVWAPSSVYGEEYTNSAYCSLPVFERKDAFKVLNMLKQQQLDFSVARPEEDWLNSYVGLYDNKGREMFYGYGWGELSIDTSGKWVPSQSLLKFDTYLAQKIPLLKDVSQARVVERDKNGNANRTEYLEVNENGEIMFTRDFVGQNGEIIVTMRDGSSIVASLSDDKVYEIIGVSAKIDASIHGVVLIPENATILEVNPESYGGYGDSPLIRGNLGKQWFTLRAMTTEGGIPYGVWYRNVEAPDGDWTYQEGDLDTDIPISQEGTYEFIINWGEVFGPMPIDYYDGGGKG